MTAKSLPWPAILGVIAAGCAGWAVFSAWQTVAAAGADTVKVLWLVPAFVVLHLFQLLLSARAWRMLLPDPPAGWSLFHRLRLVREGIDSLLPVAQVGGELVGAQLLARSGLPIGLAAASVVVDVTLEFLSQLVFLLLGVVVWTILMPASSELAWGPWLGMGALALTAAAALMAAQRFGLLRLIEVLVKHIAARLPALATLSLDGLHTSAVNLYRRRGPMLGAGALHLLAWMLGTIESWAVLQGLGFDVPWSTAFVIESLGMAGRSAGFAVPGALVVQETGFVLAAIAMGLPESAGLALSLIKRVREVSTGLIGLALWHHSGRVRA
jgi:putative membrane protein